MLFGEICLWWLFALCPAAYLIGCLNVSILITRHILHIDIQKVGSGNAGSTNVLRTAGAKWGLLVFVIDVSKGAFCSLSAMMFYGYMSNIAVIAMLSVGLACVLGNMFPVFYKFKGGKGVAHSVGVALVVNPLIAIALFVILILPTFIHRIMSITSLISTLLWASLSIVFYNFDIIGRGIDIDFWVVVLYCLFVVLIFISHRKNILRLLAGEEKQLSFETKP